MYIVYPRGDFMAHTDEFSENWRFQGENNQPLNEQTIQEFIDQNGAEQAVGYMRAIRDMINEVEFAAYDTRPEVGIGERPLTRIKNNIDKLLLHKENFLKFVVETRKLNLNDDLK